MMVSLTTALRIYGIGNNDTVPYMKHETICKRFKHMKMSYWIEDVLIATIMGFVYILILEEFYRNNRIENSGIMNMPEDEQFKLDYLRELLKDAEIARPEHVDYYLDYHNIINLMS